jgi:squalene-associated FAD-dependent desaturase
MTITIIGAGLAGLAAACTLAEAGHHITLHEATGAAGGRCRSYFDPVLNCRIDNGNHLLLSGNTATMDFLRRIGAEDSLSGPATPIFPFFDVPAGKHWSLRLNEGRLPWWIFSPSRRVPHTKPTDYISLLKLRAAGVENLVGPLIGTGPLARNLLEPLAISALNTMPDVASAAPLCAIIAETLQRGGAASLPRFPKTGLSESFIDPALAYLAARDATIHLNSRVTTLNPSQKTILAVPPWIAAELIPNLVVPDAFESIVNLHFKYRVNPGPAGFTGFIGGTAEWAFAKGDILSVTISAANRLAATGNDEIAARVWSDLCAAYNLTAKIPPFRVVREKRATFAANPAQLARRPGPRTANPNHVLAGDWTATTLPATIEGAIRSGTTAATIVMAGLDPAIHA